MFKRIVVQIERLERWQLTWSTVNWKYNLYFDPLYLNGELTCREKVCEETKKQLKNFKFYGGILVEDQQLNTSKKNKKTYQPTLTHFQLTWATILLL